MRKLKKKQSEIYNSVKENYLKMQEYNLYKIVNTMKCSISM